MDINGSELPHSLEAEQTVLGAILMNNDSLSIAMNYLKPESFYIKMHRDLFSIITRMFTMNTTADIITVIDEAVKANVFENSRSGREYLTTIASGVPSPRNIESYCKIVQEKYYIRSLMTASKEIIDMCSESDANAEQLLEMAEQKIYDIRSGKDVTGLTRIDEVITSAYGELSRRSGPDREKYLGLGSGYNDLDNIVSGLNNSDLLIVAGRPGMGKTSFVLNIAANICRHRTDKEVVIFSLEMSKEQLATRMLSAESLIESDKLMKGRIQDDDWLKLAKGADRLYNMPIYFDDTSFNVTQMKAKLRSKTKNLGLVIIDYLQLMNAPGMRNDNRVQVISEITRQLKLMAKELNVPVIVGSQLSRGVESRNDKRPVLSDLRESGSIEQDADIVMFLYREGYYNKEKCDNPNLSECIVAKNRHGETGTVNLNWNGKYTLFLAARPEDNPKA